MGSSPFRLTGLYLWLVVAGIRAQMQYRYGFFMNILGWVMTYVGTSITMWVVLYRFERLAGWTFLEMLFLFALSVFSWSFSMLLFHHFAQLDQFIVNGTFDRFLIRPIHPFFHFMTMKVEIGAIGQFLFGLGALGWVSFTMDMVWGGKMWLVFVSAVVGGTLIQGGILVLTSSLAFWALRSQGLYWGVVWPLRNLNYYPMAIFPFPLQAVLSYVLPFAFVNYFPALLLLGKESPHFPQYLGWLSFPVGAVFFALAYALWMKGLDRYKSAGS